MAPVVDKRLLRMGESLLRVIVLMIIDDTFVKFRFEVQIRVDSPFRRAKMNRLFYSPFGVHAYVGTAPLDRSHARRDESRNRILAELSSSINAIDHPKVINRYNRTVDAARSASLRSGT